ncbi:MAG TPA: hypothetical protein VKX33_05815 [Cyclobacteriaceae bacterium]|nr:hypothetical protein [Cyclobacteriaceae bacterium]
MKNYGDSLGRGSDTNSAGDIQNIHMLQYYDYLVNMVQLMHFDETKLLVAFP